MDSLGPTATDTTYFQLMPVTPTVTIYTSTVPSVALLVQKNGSQRPRMKECAIYFVSFY